MPPFDSHSFSPLETRALEDYLNAHPVTSYLKTCSDLKISSEDLDRALAELLRREGRPSLTLDRVNTDAAVKGKKEEAAHA